MIEKAAEQLAASFSVEHIGKTVLRAWKDTPRLAELRNRVRLGPSAVEDFLKEMEILELPSIENLKQRARKMFIHIPSLNPVVERANQIIVQAVSVWILQNEVSAASVGV